MSIIQHTHQVHAATCVASEGTRQNDVAQAILADGGSAVVAAAIRTSELAHYRRVISSCQANGLPYASFHQALRDLGAPSF